MIRKSHDQETLHLHDLYDPPPYLESSTLTEKLEANWFDELRRCPQNPSLMRATARMTGWRLLRIGLLLIPLVSDVKYDDISHLTFARNV